MCVSVVSVYVLETTTRQKEYRRIEKRKCQYMNKREKDLHSFLFTVAVLAWLSLSYVSEAGID